jgi:hypothetical protein
LPVDVLLLVYPAFSLLLSGSSQGSCPNQMPTNQHMPSQLHPRNLNSYREQAEEWLTEFDPPLYSKLRILFPASF